MSRFPANDYPRDRRPSPPPRWNPDRRSSYNDASRGGRGRELRDAPPLGGRPPYRDSRDFSPRDEQPRPRRNSRDGSQSAGPGYPEPSPFRPSYRGRGRGDDFRGRGGRGRFPDDRDLFHRDLSRERSPPRYYRGERSPDRHDDRPYARRDDPRWPERDRDVDRRRPELSRIDSRPLDSPSSTGPSPAVSINPDRQALIEDAIRPPTGNAPGREPRRDPLDVPTYGSNRPEPASNRYASRASSPPTQPPAVPAFGLTFPSTQPTVKADKPADTEAKIEANASVRTNLQAARSNENLGAAVAPPTAPRASLASPVLPSRAPPISAPTGPKADRPVSRSSTSPRVPFSALNRDSSTFAQVRPRSPPPASAPSGPRGHGASISPEMSFAAAPTAPRADRQSMNRGLDRPQFGARMQERGSMPLSRQASAVAPPQRPAAWNQWKKPEVDLRQEPRQEQRPTERRMSSTNRGDRMETESAPAKTVNHSAKQSFFGQPTAEIEDDQEDLDAMDDSFGASEEDDIEAEDLALFEAKFERQRRELESRLVDLSARQYRATTPLENIARLSRITMKDVEKFRDQLPDMDIDEVAPAQEQSVPPATHSSASEEAADLLTPKGEDDNSVLIHDADEEDIEDIPRRIRRPTPEAISLPFLTKNASLSLEDTRASAADNDAQAQIQASLAQERAELTGESIALEHRFAELYRRWRMECHYLDAEREAREKEAERQASFEPTIDPEQATPVNPIVEGRRMHKFSSEYELDLVLKESEETARLEKERAERAAMKDQADMEKEALIPDQLTAQELKQSLFIDNNRLREPETLTVVFSYEPAEDDFTEGEQQVFIAAFKETPKKWSEIASLLPGREPKDCIRHYYANKWDHRFRDAKSKKRGTGRRARGGKGRGKGSAMQDLKDMNDGPVAMSDSGRPKRAAAPVSFGERESEAKAMLSGQSPAKRAGPSAGGQADGEKPAKRRRAVGDKTARKVKGAPALASLAAAPHLSPDGRPLPTQSKDLNRSRLEDASLLTGFHAGHAMPSEPQMVFAADAPYMHRGVMDNAARHQAALQGSSAKPSPSSYWSVPEQQDFDKYIKHFGTDFTAIAQHMGTKTHTMIKNHYQRQIDGGKRELEANAMAANARRERGEDLGAPPVPTPITKRKYDQPTPSTQRSLVPLGEPMDIDDGIGSRAGLKQHGSPPQYPMQPRYLPATTSTIQPGRMGEPLGTPSMANARPYQPRASVYQDPRAAARPSIGSTSTFMAPQLAASQQGRSVQEASDPHFIQSLLEEQKRAQRLQDHYQGQDRADVYQPRQSLQSTSQQSPLVQSALVHGERKPIMHDPRSNSPPSGFFPSRSMPGSRPFDSMRHTYQATIPSPPKRDVPAAPYHPTPAAEPPKRSNVMSLLNDTPEEPKPKRSSLDLAPPSHQHGSPPHAAPYQPRIDPYAAQHGQPPFSRQSSGPAVSSSLKQEPLSASSASIQSSIPPKQDWPRSTTTLTPPSAPAYERRPFFPQSTMLGQLGTPSRANPSPPPHGALHHSRTPSMAPAEPAQRPYVPGPPVSAAAQSSLYHPASYSQPPATSQAPAHDHSMGSSLATGYPPPHSRMPSRDERPQQYFGDRERDRERQDRDWRWKQEDDAAARRHADSQRYEQDRAYQRPPTMQPPMQGSYPYDQGAPRAEGGMSMREQAFREAHLFTQHEEERVRSSTSNYRDREREQADEAARRRHDDAFMPGGARRTPLGGGFGGPLPPRR